jgi:DNA (cytosine-5)-methyltransferase 1
LLDLYCGAGGAAMGYHRAGFDVLGVDVKPQPRYPFAFVQADALETLSSLGFVRHFSVIHASPPCQAYSTATSRPELHADLYVQTRDALTRAGLPWIIENVLGAPAGRNIILCGSMFGLGVRRHRRFETSFPTRQPLCDHERQGITLGIYGHGGGGRSARPSRGGGTKAKPSQFAQLMEMEWAKPREIVQAIPPVYTEYLGRQLLRQLSPDATLPGP